MTLFMGVPSPVRTEIVGGLQFDYRRTAYGDHEIIARDLNQREIGSLNWSPRGSTRTIDVCPAWRRHGVATAMWNHARTLDVIHPHHSSVRSDDGTAWAKAVGGHLPINRLPKSRR